MNLLSFKFILFLIGTAVLYFALPKRLQWWVLLAGSLYFYSRTGWRNLIFIGITAVTTWAASNFISRNHETEKAWLKENKAIVKKEARTAYKKSRKKRRQIVFWTTIFLNFGLLCYFKYLNFVLAQVSRLAQAFGNGQTFDSLELIVPLGISFYTFQTMGYLTDVYWKKVTAEKNIFRMLLFTIFFPQMTQGPISTWQDFSAELFAEHRFTYHQYSWGIQRMLWGYFKKMVVANMSAVYVEDVFANYSSYAGISVMLGAFLYSLQIYADFSGYMDIVCGFCEILGIRLTENFERPYFSKSIAEYWRRWHISLGAWFKAYVYYPIAATGWNQKFGRFCMHKFGRYVGRTIPASIALVGVWFATGLWHGASWGYIAWGGANGLVIIFSIWMKPVYEKMKQSCHIKEQAFWWRAFQVIRTFVLVTLIKVLPEVGSLGDGIGLWKQIFLNHTIPHGFRALCPFVHGRLDFLVVMGGAVLMFAVSIIQRRQPVRQWLEKRSFYPVRVAGYVLLLIVTVYFGTSTSQLTGGFLYEQF